MLSMGLSDLGVALNVEDGPGESVRSVGSGVDGCCWGVLGCRGAPQISQEVMEG